MTFNTKNWLELILLAGFTLLPMELVWAHSSCNEGVQDRTYNYCTFENGDLLQVQYLGACMQMTESNNNRLSIMDSKTGKIKQMVSIPSNYTGNLSLTSGNISHQGIRCSGNAAIGIYNWAILNKEKSTLAKRWIYDPVKLLFSVNTNGELKTKVVNTETPTYEDSKSKVTFAQLTTGFVLNKDMLIAVDVFPQADIGSEYLGLWDLDLNEVLHSSNCYLPQDLKYSSAVLKNKLACYTQYRVLPVGPNNAQIHPRGLKVIDIQSGIESVLLKKNLEIYDVSNSFISGSKLYSTFFDDSIEDFKPYLIILDLITGQNIKVNIIEKDGQVSFSQNQLMALIMPHGKIPLSNEIYVNNEVRDPKTNRYLGWSRCLVKTSDLATGSTLKLSTSVAETNGDFDPGIPCIVDQGNDVAETRLETR